MLKENRYKKIKTYLQNRRLFNIIDTSMGKMLRYKSQNLKQESSRKKGYIARYVLQVKEQSKLEKNTDLASFKFYSEK